MRSMFRVVPTLLLASVACSSSTEPATTRNAPSALTSITAQAPDPSATCTYGPGITTGTYAGVVVWSKLSVWAIRFTDGNGTIASGALTHPNRTGPAGLSSLARFPTGVDLLGRTGQTLLSVSCTEGPPPV
jgi:hypothetical protein